MKEITPPIIRFKKSYTILDNGCWQWQKSTNKGYGRFNNGSKIVDAHRWYYQLVNKLMLRSEEHLDHLCRNRACVNPGHLEVVDNYTNWLRGESITLQKKQQTHCIHGHKFDETNTYYKKNGSRRCNKCHAISERKYRLQRKRIKL